MLAERSPPSEQALTQEYILERICFLYDLIGEDLKEPLNALRGSDSDSDDDDVELAIGGILSVFDPDPEALPRRYGQNLATAVSRTPPNQLFIERNLSATIYKMAVQDETLYRYLARVVDRDVRARDFFAKQLGRAQRATRQLDLFAQRGPSNTIPNQDMDVGECGRILRRIVSEICAEREAILSGGPPSQRTRERAAETLVRILEGVVLSYDREIYGDNLYTYLIGDPTRPGNGQDDDEFVIEALGEFPSSEYSHLAERLENIAIYIRQNAPHDPHPSLRYAAKIEEMIHNAGNPFDNTISPLQTGRPNF